MLSFLVDTTISQERGFSSTSAKPTRMPDLLAVCLLLLAPLAHQATAVRPFSTEAQIDSSFGSRQLLFGKHKKQYPAPAPAPPPPPPPQQVAAAPAPAPFVAQPREAPAPVVAYSQAIAMSSPSPTHYIPNPTPPQQVAAAPAPAPPPANKPTVVVVPSPSPEPSCPYGKKTLLCRFLGYSG